MAAQTQYFSIVIFINLSFSLPLIFFESSVLRGRKNEVVVGFDAFNARRCREKGYKCPHRHLRLLFSFAGLGIHPEELFFDEALSLEG